MNLNRKCWLWIDRQLAASSLICQLLLPIILLVVLLFITYAMMHIDHSIHTLSCMKYDPVNGVDASVNYLLTNGGQNVYPGNHLFGQIFTLVGIVLIAILTSVFTNWLDKRAKGYLSGETAYRLRDHIVILGTNDIIYSIIEQKSNSDTYFLIQTTRDVEKTRREVFAFLKNKHNNIVFIYGDRTSPEDIARLSLEKAREVFVIGDNIEKDQTESYRDAYNMDCINAVSSYLKSSFSRSLDKLKTVPYHVLFEYQTTFSAFQYSDIPDGIRETMTFKPFNIYEMWAQQVLVNGYAGSYDSTRGCYEYNYKFLGSLPKGGYISEEQDKTVHLIIVGMSKMGIAMGIEAAHLCHYPNFVKNKSQKTKITFIDADADLEKDFFIGRFKALFQYSNASYYDMEAGTEEIICAVSGENDWLDIEWEFRKGRVEQKNVQEYLESCVEDENRTVTIAICIPQSNESIAAALYLPEKVHDKCLQILTYQRLSGYIINNISRTEDDKADYRYKCLRPFGMIDYGYAMNLDNDAMAMMDDYVYSTGEVTLSSYVEDEYLDIWRDKKVSDRWSSVFNANSIGEKLRSIGCNWSSEFDDIRKKVSENIHVLEEMEHNRWNLEKLLTGFRPLDESEKQEMHNQLGKISGEPANVEHTPYYDKKKSYKNGASKAHLDLCSYSELSSVDKWAIQYDTNLCTSIPYIVRKMSTEYSNILKQNSNE